MGLAGVIMMMNRELPIVIIITIGFGPRIAIVLIIMTTGKVVRSRGRPGR